MLLKKRTLIVFASFLTLSACASPQKGVKFDAEWIFLEDELGATVACLYEDDVKELKEIMIRCEKK